MEVWGVSFTVNKFPALSAPVETYKHCSILHSFVPKTRSRGRISRKKRQEEEDEEDEDEEYIDGGEENDQVTVRRVI